MSAFRMSSMLRVAARVPGIKFPTRRLPDGTRVSDLPAGTRWSTRAQDSCQKSGERETNNVPLADLFPPSTSPSANVHP